MTNILIIEDEDKLRAILKEYFLKEGFSIFEAADGKEGIEIFQEEEIDLVILDIMLPELDGWSICRRIRKNSDVPIIMCTARSDDDDKLLGYDLGADEYVTKPYSPKVLIARAKAMLRRSTGKEEGMLSLSGINVDTLGRKVYIDEEEIALTHKEFELLLYLMEHKGVVLSREVLLNQVWGYDYFGDDRTVDTHIKKLRKKLGEKAVHIRTVIRSGYRFEE